MHSPWKEKVSTDGVKPCRETSTWAAWAFACVDVCVCVHVTCGACLHVTQMDVVECYICLFVFSRDEETISLCKTEGTCRVSLFRRFFLSSCSFPSSCVRNKRSEKVISLTCTITWKNHNWALQAPWSCSYLKRVWFVKKFGDYCLYANTVEMNLLSKGTDLMTLFCLCYLLASNITLYCTLWPKLSLFRKSYIGSLQRCFRWDLFIVWKQSGLTTRFYDIRNVTFAWIH